MSLGSMLSGALNGQPSPQSLFNQAIQGPYGIKPPTQPVQNDAPTGGGAYAGGGTGYVDPYAAQRSQDNAFLDIQQGNLQRLLQSTQTGLQNGLTGLEDSFNKETSSANLQRSRALEDFNTKKEDTTRAKQSSLNKVDSSARQGAGNLRRLIGMASGSGSSAFQLAAPQAVSSEASKRRGSVLESFGANFRDLDTAETRAKVDFDNLLADLQAQRRQKESELRAGVLEREQSINQSLAQLAAERARVNGGDYNAIRTAQQPYADAVNSRQSELDGLFARFRTPYTVKPVEVQNPNLRDYTVDKAAINANRTEGAAEGSPYSQFLKKKTEQYV